ncbi:MAG: EAL domain-containing protein [Rhodospirillaceae bacterium]|nr:EAL domain-containing protein [Rhodospirillaceae bacterium]
MGLALLACVATGGLAGRSLGDWLVLDSAQDRVNAVATALMERTDEYYEMVVSLLIEANGDRLGPCSDDELFSLRRMAFATPVVADIGRLRGGRMICATSAGRLAEPIDQGEPDFVDGRGVRWFIDTDILLSEEISGPVLELGNISAVVDPRVFTENDSPGIALSLLAIDPFEGTVLRTVDDGFPFDARLLVGENAASDADLGLSDYLTALVCGGETIVCVAAAQTEDDARARGDLLVKAFGGMGGLVGASAFFVGFLLIRHDRSLPSQLRRAIRNDRLHVEYQPQVDFRDWRVVGMEALVRWTDESGVRHRPDHFVAVAEQHGFVSEITALVIRHVVHDTGALLLERPELHVSINFAAADLAGRTQVTLLDQALAAAGVPASQVTLELTERAACNDPQLKATLNAARAAGHQVAIDDFGIGFSNLSHLQCMPVDYLKVDKSFTDTVGTDSPRASIVPQILGMASALDLGVVVEGVETEQQVAYFAERGARIGQGWVFARAMPIDEFCNWLADWDVRHGGREVGT